MSSQGMVTDNLATAFKSKRLLYRAFENNEHDRRIMHEIENDPEAAALSTPSKIMPRSTKYTEGRAEAFTKSVLGVMICLAPPPPPPPLPLPGSDDPSIPVTTSSISAAAATAPPIGYMVLGWGAGDGPADQSQHRTIAVGIALSAGYRGQGYGGEAIDWALDWAFRYGGYRRVEISTTAFNERALHLYRRLGFVEEGRRRQAHWYDRRWWDRVDFGMLEHEWAARRGLLGEGEGEGEGGKAGTVQ